MKQIIRGRCAGKTTQAIKLSAETGSYILVSSKNQARLVAKKAEELGVNIPYPVSVSELTAGKLEGSSLKRNGIIIDEALQVLQELLNVKINAVTISTNDYLKKYKEL